MLCRFITAGSVDDGKSTLMGRILFESKSIYADQLNALSNKSKSLRQSSELDLSLLTDGLEEEQNKGITIDVAYRYFSTSKRKFIMADSPGHQEYTRNMMTAASTADLMLILIDAARMKNEKDLLVQTKRHTWIAKLLSIQTVFLCVNKMDAVDYRQQDYERLRDLYLNFATQIGLSDVHSFPLSALKGDNVTQLSGAMPWYSGPTLMQALEEIEISKAGSLDVFRMPVQLALSHHGKSRALGRIEAGQISVGDQVVFRPSHQQASVKNIFVGESAKSDAQHGESVSLEFDQDIEIQRGQMLVKHNEVSSLSLSTKLHADVCWLNEEPLNQEKKYLLKIHTQIVSAKVTQVEFVLDPNSFQRQAGRALGLNDIGQIQLETDEIICFDRYQEVPSTGCFILIDPENHNTLAAGMIR